MKTTNKSVALSEVDSMKLAVVKIKNGDDFNNGVEILSRLNRMLDDVVAEKEKVTKPLNEALKAERERFKPYERKLEEAIKMIKDEMSGYQMRLLAEKKKAEEKAAKELASGKIDIGAAVDKLAVAGKGLVEGRVETASGAVKFRTDRVVRIVDEAKIPREYMIADMKKIKEALMAGVAVRGTVLEEVQTVVNYR